MDIIAGRIPNVSGGHLVGNQVGICTAQVRENYNREAVVGVS
jgi:hypothetical protein